MTGAGDTDSVESMADHERSRPSPPAIPASNSRHRPLGLPVVAVIGLALLAVPRVIVHDLDLIQEGSAINALLVFVPPVAWIVVALVARVRHPFVTILAIGVCYGVFLALGHQFMWGIAFADNPPRLGGNLAGLDPSTQSVIVRSFAALSSFITGAVVGAVAGLVAWGLSTLIQPARRKR